MKTKLGMGFAAVLLIAACSGSNNEPGTDTSVANNETDMSTPDTAQPNNGTPDTGTPDIGTPDDTGDEPDTAPPVDMGPQRLAAHACTYAAATDMTGTAAINITDIAGWEIGHNVCLIVSAGTVLTWDGNFTAHPLKGGVAPMADATNPIQIAGDGVTGAAAIDVTLADTGDYGYYCGIHTTSMRGVIYVD